MDKGNPALSSPAPPPLGRASSPACWALGRGRGGVEQALKRVTCPSLLMSVRTDFLYPRHQQIRVVDALKGRVPVEHIDIDSDNGHDGFLTEPEQTGAPMGDFIDKVAKGSIA